MTKILLAGLDQHSAAFPTGGLFSVGSNLSAPTYLQRHFKVRSHIFVSTTITARVVLLDQWVDTGDTAASTIPDQMLDQSKA